MLIIPLNITPANSDRSRKSKGRGERNRKERKRQSRDILPENNELTRKDEIKAFVSIYLQTKSFIDPPT